MANNVSFNVQILDNTPAVVSALGVTAASACKLMANDTREKTKNAIGGNRTASNPFPRNKVKRDGTYYKNSVARAPGKPPKFYIGRGGVKHPDTKGPPSRSKISLMQVHYAKNTAKTNTVLLGGGKTIDTPTYVVGPIGKAPGTPRLLETGGTTTSYYREVKKNGTTVRWEFAKKLKHASVNPKAVMGGKDYPVRYASWSEINDRIRAKGGQVGGRRDMGTYVYTPGADMVMWKGPKAFTVRPRPYISKAWERVRKRSKYWITKALPDYSKQYRKLTIFLTAA